MGRIWQSTGRPATGPRRVPGFFGLALECEPRGQITGTDPGEFLAPTTDEWVHDSILSVGRFIKGANWEVYKTAAVARGATAADFVEDATYVEVTNSAVHPFLSLFDVVVMNTFQHGGISPIDAKSVKDLAATAGQKTRRFMTARPPNLVLHGWKDDMPSGYHSSTLWNHYYEAARDNGLFMRGTSVGSTGSWMCDPEETLAWPGGVVKDLFADPPTETAWQATGSGHNWHLDYTKPAFAEIMADAAYRQYRDYYMASGGAGEPIDQYMIHDIVPTYPARAGTATNLPTIDPDYWYGRTSRIPDAYRAAFRRTSQLAGEVWTCYGAAWDRAIGGSIPFVRNVGGIYYNYNWSTVLADARVYTDIGYAKESGIPIALGSNTTHATQTAFFTTPDHPKWWTYLAAARRHEWEENTYIAQSNEIGYLFWTPAMRPVG